MSRSLRRIAEAYADADRWQRAAASRELKEAMSAEDRIEQLRAELARIGAEIARLEERRDEAQARAHEVTSGWSKELYATLFDVWIEQALEVEDRTRLWLKASLQRDTACLAALSDGNRAAQLAEYVESRRVVEHDLEELGEAQRQQALARYHAAREPLIAWFDQNPRPVIDLDLADLILDVRVAMDQPEPDFAVAMVVLPVVEAVATHWADRPSGLGMALASRVAAGLYRVAHDNQQWDANLVVGAHRGVLVLEFEMQGSASELCEALCVAIQASLDQDQELLGAGIRVQVAEISLDEILPPVTEDLQEAADA